MFVILSDVWLDNAEVCSSITGLIWSFLLPQTPCGHYCVYMSIYKCVYICDITQLECCKRLDRRVWKVFWGDNVRFTIKSLGCLLILCRADLWKDHHHFWWLRNSGCGSFPLYIHGKLLLPSMQFGFPWLHRPAVSKAGFFLSTCRATEYVSHLRSDLMIMKVSF